VSWATRTLVDGSVVPADSQEWRHECEARAILALPSLQQRRDWLAYIEAKRGRGVRERLERTMLALRRFRP